MKWKAANSLGKIKLYLVVRLNNGCLNMLWYHLAISHVHLQIQVDKKEPTVCGRGRVTYKLMLIFHSGIKARQTRLTKVRPEFKV